MDVLAKSMYGFALLKFQLLIDKTQIEFGELRVTKSELVEELNGLLTGATLRDVEARPPRDAVLAFLPGSQGPDAPILRIYLSCQGETGRLHLQHGRLARHTGPEGPFYQRLMEDLPGAELRKIQQVRGDRLVLFEFSTEKGRRALVLELTGRHSNLLLLGKGDEVLELLVSPPKKQAEPRLVRGLPWTPPPGRAEEIELQGITEAFPAPKEEPDSVKRGHPHRAPLSYWVECALAPAALGRDGARLSRRHVDGRAR